MYYTIILVIKIVLVQLYLIILIMELATHKHLFNRKCFYIQSIYQDF